MSCVVPDWFVQSTVSPTVMTRLVGTKTKLAGPRTLTIFVVAAGNTILEQKNVRLPTIPISASLYVFIRKIVWTARPPMRSRATKAGDDVDFTTARGRYSEQPWAPNTSPEVGRRSRRSVSHPRRHP